MRASVDGVRLKDGLRPNAGTLIVLFEEEFSRDSRLVSCEGCLTICGDLNATAESILWKSLWSFRVTVATHAPAPFLDNTTSTL